MDPSHVLRAMKVPFTVIHGAVRFSLSRDNTTEDIDATIEAVTAIVGKLRPVRAGAPELAAGPGSGDLTSGDATPQGSYI
jgi:cysteine desulfurase